jgi:hypothetical protein
VIHPIALIARRRPGLNDRAGRPRSGEKSTPGRRRGTLDAMAPRRPITVAQLAARVAALEERLARLECGRAPPGDGRAAPSPARARGTRCPGCGLPLRRRAGRCTACGRPIDSL